jgi:hypothetical protein
MSDRSQDLAHLHGLVPLKRRSIQQREASQPRFQLAFYVAGTIREHRESSVFNRLADTRKEVILEGREDGEVKFIDSKWWPETGSNRRRRPFQGRALPLSYLALGTFQGRCFA